MSRFEPQKRSDSVELIRSGSTRAGVIEWSADTADSDAASRCFEPEGSKNVPGNANKQAGAAGTISCETASHDRTIKIWTIEAADVLALQKAARPDLSPDDAACDLVPSVLRPIIRRWTALFRADSEARAVQHPAYVLAELQAAPWQPWPADHARAVLFAASDWSSAGVLLPKLLRVPAVPPPGLGRTLHGARLVGNRLFGDQSPESHVRLLTAAMDYLQGCNLQFLLLEDVDERSALWRSLAELDDSIRVFVPDPFQARLRIHLAGSAEQYWNQFTSRTRCKLRRKLRRASGRVQRVTEPEQVEDFLRHAHAVSLHTWQTRQFGLRIKNDQRERLLLTALARLGALRSYLLWHDDQPVAFTFGTQFNGWYEYEEAGYDSRFSHLSPGQVLLMHILEDLFHHDPPEWFDFGGGDAEYKRTFANDQSRSGNVLLLPRNTVTGIVTATWRSRQALGRAARRVLATVGLWKTIRRWSRRGWA